LDAVRCCWTSLFNTRLLSYLLHHGKRTGTEQGKRLSMAVVVQDMVTAAVAGVAFSADPVTGQPNIVIESVPGLGNALAAGLAEPDRTVFDARRALVEASSASNREPSLPEEEALRLADMVRAVASQRGAPQDVEWAGMAPNSTCYRVVLSPGWQASGSIPTVWSARCCQASSSRLSGL
jgi:pyruvate,water dikinase